MRRRLGFALGLALLTGGLAHAVAPPEAPRPSGATRPSGWRSARAGDFVEYRYVGGLGWVTHLRAYGPMAPPYVYFDVRLRLQTLSVDDQGAVVLLTARGTSPKEALHPALARGLRVPLSFAPLHPALEPRPSPQGGWLTVEQAGRPWRCRMHERDNSPLDGPTTSECIAPGEPVLYLSGGLVHSRYAIGFGGHIRSTALILEAVGHAAPEPGAAEAPLAFEKGSWYRVLKESRQERLLWRHAYDTGSGRVRLSTSYSRPLPPGSPGRGEQVDGETFAIEDLREERELEPLEFATELVDTLLEAGVPQPNATAHPTPVRVAGTSVLARRDSLAEVTEPRTLAPPRGATPPNPELEKLDTVFTDRLWAVDPWAEAFRGAPVAARFTPLEVTVRQRLGQREKNVGTRRLLDWSRPAGAASRAPPVPPTADDR